MALHQVRLTGIGQVVDASIYESVLNMMENTVTEYDVGDYIRERTGSFLPKIAPSNVYPTKEDVWFVIGANQDWFGHVWRKPWDILNGRQMNALLRIRHAGSTDRVG